MKRDDILQTIRGAMKVVTPELNVEPTTNIANGNLDSMAIVDFFLEMETRTGVSFKEAAVEEHDLTKIENLIAFLEKQPE